jgi:ABC-type branched-subunit amino acid transport system substrate-binding protein
VPGALGGRPQLVVHTPTFSCRDPHRVDVLDILYRLFEKPGGTLRRSRVFTALVIGALVSASLLATTAIGAGAQSSKPKADEVGITDTQIRLAVIADVDNSLAPGVFKASVDAMRAWAKVVNKEGGVAGRKVVIDFIDSKLSPNETRNAIIKACANDFAMVGGEALFMNNVDDMVACQNQAGKAIGLPDMPGLALDPAQQCSPVTYGIIIDGPYCKTKDQNPQTYLASQGDARFFLSQNKDLHGVWLLPADLKSTKNGLIPSYTAMANLGIKKDGEGFYDTFQTDPQSALTPVIQEIKSANSTFAYSGSDKMASLRKEATLQGVTSVKVWGCTQACYSKPFLEAGGADVEGTYSVITTLPFYTEYQLNPTLKKLVAAVGGIDKVDSNAVASWLAALLFQDAAGKAVAAGGTFDRQAIFDALKTETKFDAQGIMGPTNVADHLEPTCIVETQVKDGKLVRVFPKKAGTFNCSPKNVVEIKLDLP